MNDDLLLKEYDDCLDLLVDSYIHPSGLVMIRQTYIINGEFSKQVKTISKIEEIEKIYDESKVGIKQNNKLAQKILKEKYNAK